MAQVGLDHLTRIFTGPGGQEIRAVDDASLVVQDKELLVLVGPSGCGKTTTLRLIAGLEEPTSGSISFNGQQVTHLPPGKRDVAMVFQNHALYPQMSVYDNLAFGLKLRHCPRAEIEQRVQDAAQMLDLTACLDRRPASLSGGQCQRVALGRALVRRPQVFLLDEPLSNLDAQTRLQMRAEIVRLHARLGATMIYVTHDQTEALTIGHRVAVMKEGKLQQVGAPMDLYQHPANLFVAGFIGFPPMNFLPGALTGKGDSLIFEEQHAAGEGVTNPLTVRLDGDVAARLRPYAGQQVVLGIRPEHITCSAGAPDAPPEGAAEAVVELVQSLGSETHLHLSVHGRPVVARVPAQGHFSVSQKVFFTVEARHARFYDPASGTAIAQNKR